MINKGKQLQLDFTVEDESVFAMLYLVTINYRRSFGEWPEHVCAENIRWSPGRDGAVRLRTNNGWPMMFLLPKADLAAERNDSLFVEARWLSLARSLEFTQRLERFSDEAKRVQK